MPYDRSNERAYFSASGDASVNLMNLELEKRQI